METIYFCVLLEHGSLVALSNVAHDQKYVRPQLSEDNVLMIKAGRCAISVLSNFQFYSWIWVPEVLAETSLLRLHVGCRHPLQECTVNTFVPNDTNIDQFSGKE
jgi:DNA mismatch repair ATPase MutS